MKKLTSGTAILAIHMEGQGKPTQDEMKFKLTFKNTISGQESENELAEK